MVRSLLFILFGMVTVPAFAQWEAVTGPDVANISKIKRIGDDLFAAGGKAIYKSSDGGTNWEILTSGIPSFFSVYGFAYFNGDFFVSGSRAMYKQSSGSSDWTEISTGLPKSGNYPAPVFEFYLESDSLYGITNRGPVVWNSTSNSWQERGVSLKVLKPNYYVNHFIFDPDLWVLTIDTVFVSTDKGATWQKATGFSEFDQPRNFIRNGSTLFCTSSSIYKSTDNGLTWTSFMGDRTFLNNERLVISDGKLLNFDPWSVWSSPLDSPVWTSESLNVPYFSLPVALFADGSRLFGGFVPQGVMISDDGGVSWKKMNNGMNNLDPERFWKVNDGVIFEFGDYECWSYSVSSGQWAKLTMPNEGNLFNVDNDFNYFAEYNGKLIGAAGDLWESADNGKTWQFLNSINLETLAITDTLWIGINSNGPHVSYDQGKTWTQSNTGIGRLSATWMVARDGIFAAANSSQGFFYSSDGGRNWLKRNEGFSWPNGYRLTSLTWHDGYYYVTNNGAAGSPVWRSNDLTKNWVGFGGNLTNNGSGNMVVGDGNALFFTGYSNGLAWMTTDQNKWTLFSTGLPDGSRDMVVTVGKEVWVGVDGWGLFKTDGSTFAGAQVNVEETLVQTHGVFSLVGNYPNPFNPSTTIVVDLKAPAVLTVTVFNALGQIVANPVQSKTVAAGRRSIPFNAMNLASGTYLYRVEASGLVKTGMMMLVK